MRKPSGSTKKIPVVQGANGPNGTGGGTSHSTHPHLGTNKSPGVTKNKYGKGPNGS